VEKLLTVENFRLLCCNEEPYNGRVYFVKDNRKRWIPSGDFMVTYGLKWENVEVVSADYISGFETGRALPNPNLSYVSTMPPIVMHDYIGASLSGKGLEFGAASNPFPTSPNSEMEYADLYDHSLTSSPYHGNVHYTNSDFVKCKYITSIEKMIGIPDESFDFIIACHVIEHVSNPLLALESVWKKLKPKGKFVLLVPHMDLTFDAKRDLTTLEHIVLDYKRPLKERDFLHFVEFYEKAFVAPNPFQKASQEFTNGFSDIHFHTWNEASFLNMVNYFSDNIRKWSEITFYPHMRHEHANEFYFILEK
jgi:SAM-dependent methyltransferase